MEFQEVAKERRTIRRFKQVQVLDKDLTHMIDVGRRVSCAANMQLLRYTVLQNKSIVKQIFETTAWGGFVTPRRTPEFGKNAPLTFIAVCTLGESTETVHANAGAAIQAMQYAAWDVGLGCCWIGAFNKQRASEILEVPPESHLLYLLAVGYPDEEPVQDDIDLNDSPKYYLDDNDVLHVPKYKVEAITEWR
ncbi:nitroreductase family protein [Lentisphaerota bacterium ZTH]|nr:nitroreductase family protein [Lentisphaerota bacterium]WET05124.1 nitroreductase family protein [Lentisphaerota bacterium ZTH]